MILPTILSRCQRYDFKSLTVNEIEEILNLDKGVYIEFWKKYDDFYRGSNAGKKAEATTNLNNAIAAIKLSPAAVVSTTLFLIAGNI